ncbi:MAG TPA: DUF1653 domain-containing protein [Candidatus Dojkabacteria bacterium]|nr:DUF1653 domain-containing protein [Candidatus Dojkabacteria bacterium]
MKRKFQPGVYKHFKGGMYLALMLAKDSETEEDVVVYIPPYYNNINISKRNYYNQETEKLSKTLGEILIGVRERIKMEKTI